MAILHSRPTADGYITRYFSNAVVPEFSCSLRRKKSSGAHKKISRFFKALSQHCEKRLLDSSRLSVCLFFCMEQLCSHWKDLHEIWYMCIFRNSVEKIQLFLKPDKNKGCFARRPIHIYYHISLISS